MRFRLFVSVRQSERHLSLNMSFEGPFERLRESLSSDAARHKSVARVRRASRSRALVKAQNGQLRHQKSTLGGKIEPRSPRAPQETSKSAQRLPREHSGRHFEAGMLEKAPFESELPRDSVKKRVLNDFRSIFKACAQTPNLDFEATLQRFLKFFKNRLVVARADQFEWQSEENIQHAAPVGPESIQDCSKSFFGSSFEQLRASQSS